MKIVIAHPNASYVEATRQVLSVQNQHYLPLGATTLQEVVDHFTKADFDILLIDSELANGKREIFCDTIKKISHDLPVILTINEDDDFIAIRGKELGVFECVIKRKGYLAALSESLKRAAKFKKRLQPAQPPIHKITSLPVKEEKSVSLVSGESGYFVCDRKGRFLSVSKYLQKVTGYTNDELLELTIIDILSLTDSNDFFNKVFNIAAKKPAASFDVFMLNKGGQKSHARIQLSLIYDDTNPKLIIGFRGNLIILAEEKTSVALQKYSIDQKNMISEIVDVIHRSYTDSIDVLLKNLSELVCQVFGFKRSTVALLDPRKHAFVKQAMVGYAEKEDPASQQTMEVPQKVVEKIFSDKSHVKVIYHKKEQRQLTTNLNHELVQNNSLDNQPIPEWHKRDLIILNLTDQSNRTFGYISLDEPHPGNVPTKATFYNLELFSRLVSITVENYYRISTLERRNRRMKQILVNSNVFKLYYSLSELLKEVVWSVKFSLDFSMVSLVLISKKSGMLETKAVACEDKVKLAQIKELNYDLAEFSNLLRKEYMLGKSYFVKNEERILRPLKRVYYGSDGGEFFADCWPNWAVIIVPIKSREGKIIGFLIVDDPVDCRLPSLDTMHTLEILANQIAIAIDNRVMYVQAKERSLPEPDLENEQPEALQNEPAPQVAPGAAFIQESNAFLTPQQLNTQIPVINQEEIKPVQNETQDEDVTSSDFFEEADFTKTGFKKLVERFLR
ncbi:MAG TPA: PAS domain S-box protein [bacterium]|nr:PAS domain S-box protein [bacterium]HPN45408.1 PAS domain S-box protein [bacterium]